MIFSFYNDHYEPSRTKTSDSPSEKTISFADYCESVRNGTYANYDRCKKYGDLKAKYQETNLEEDKKAYNAYGMLFPCVTPCGIFKGASPDDLVEHSYIACLDADNVTDVDAVCQQFAADSHCLAVHKSRSGNGVCAFFYVDKNNYEKIYQSLLTYWGSKGIQLDSSARALNKMRAMSYDCNIYVNPKAKMWDKIVRVDAKGKAKSFIHDHGNLLRICQEMKDLGICITDDYLDYIRCAFALIDEYGDSPYGLEAFHALCETYHKYSKGDTNEKYANCLKNSRIERENGCTIAWVYSRIKEAVRHANASIEIYDADMKKRIKTAISYIRTATDDKSITEEMHEQGVTPEFVRRISGSLKTAEAVVSDSLTREQMILEAMGDKGYEPWLNTMNNRPMFGDEYCDDVDLNSISNHIERNFGKIVPPKSIVQILASDSVPNINPLKEYFKSLEDKPYKNGSNYNSIFADLARCFYTKEESDRIESGWRDTKRIEENTVWLRKWFLGLVENSIGKVHDCPLGLWFYGSKQGVGKTYAARNILPPFFKNKKLTAVKLNLIAGNSINKDAAQWLVSYSLLIFEEMKMISSGAIDMVKAYLSGDDISWRKNYGIFDSNKPRISMCIFTGNGSVLYDDDDNRRLLPIESEHVDWELFNSIDKEQLIIAALRITQSGLDSHLLTAKEKDILRVRCKGVVFRDPVSDWLISNFSPVEAPGLTKVIALPSEIASAAKLLGGCVSLSPQKTTNMLKKEGFKEQVRKRIAGGGEQKCYELWCESDMIFRLGGILPKNSMIVKDIKPAKTVDISHIERNDTFDNERIIPMPTIRHSDILDNDGTDDLPF